MKLILASKSFRRKKILEQVGFVFDVFAGNYEEVLDQSAEPHTLVQQLSVGKAKNVAVKKKDGVILAADTLIVKDGEIIGKPKDRADAMRILHKLSGASHSAITGFTILDAQTGKTVTGSVETVVTFRDLTDSEINGYVDSGEPMDKAGAYGAQDKGALFITRIEGDFYNIVGLPVCAVAEQLKNFGISAIM